MGVNKFFYKNRTNLFNSLNILSIRTEIQLNREALNQIYFRQNNKGYAHLIAVIATNGFMQKNKIKDIDKHKSTDPDVLFQETEHTKM